MLATTSRRALVQQQRRCAGAALATYMPSSLCAQFSSTTGNASSSSDAATAKSGTTSNASASVKPTAATTAAAAASKKKGTPMQNLKDVMDALDIMIEEAEKKVEKKYRPNMFAEFKQLNDTNGKVVVGPEQLVDVSNAKPFPSLQATSLSGKTVDLQQLVTSGSKATLVLTSFKNFGMNMLPAWRDGFAAAFATADANDASVVQTATLNIIEDWYMKLVQPSITRGLQTKTPTALHDHTFAHFGRCDDVRTALDLYNSFTGYAHLVDAKGRIRWMAAGEATPEELERLVRVTKQLVAQSSQTRRR